MSETVHEVWDGDADDAGESGQLAQPGGPEELEAAGEQDAGGAVDDEVVPDDALASEEPVAKKKPNLLLLGAGFLVVVGVVSVGINSMIKSKQAASESGFDEQVVEHQAAAAVDLMGGGASAPEHASSGADAMGDAGKASEPSDVAASAVTVDPVAAAASNPMMKPSERAEAVAKREAKPASGDVVALGERVGALAQDVSEIRADLSEVKSRVDALLSRKVAVRSESPASGQPKVAGARRVAQAKPARGSRALTQGDVGREVTTTPGLNSGQVVAAAPGVSGVAAVTVDVPKEEPKAAVSSRQVSPIAGMKLRAVFPAVGPDAQAWVVDGAGRVFAVVKGDKLNGETVTAIGRDGVGTSAGMIRPE